MAQGTQPRTVFSAGWLLAVIVAIVVLVLVAGWFVIANGASPTVATARSGDFQLTLSSAQSDYPNGEKIDVSASVEYTGPKDSVQVYGTYKTSEYPSLLIGHPFVGLVYFSAEQLDGPISIPGIGGPTTCTAETLARGEPVTQPVRNDLEYYPGHPLPAGTYRITAHASFGSSCNHPIDLSASLIITVSKYAATPGPPTPPTPTPAPTPTLRPAPAGYTVDIAPGVQPRWTADAAAATAYAAMFEGGGYPATLLVDPQILSVEAVRGSDVPAEFGGSRPGSDLVWIVSAQGTFSTDTHGSQREVFLGTRGYFLYSDYGEAVGGGFTRIPAVLTGHFAGDAGLGCTWLTDDQGTSWDIQWPPGWQVSFTANGTALLMAPSSDVAGSGDTLGVTGGVVTNGHPCVVGHRSFAVEYLVYRSY